MISEFFGCLLSANNNSLYVMLETAFPVSLKMLPIRLDGISIKTLNIVCNHNLQKF